MYKTILAIVFVLVVAAGYKVNIAEVAEAREKPDLTNLEQQSFYNTRQSEKPYDDIFVDGNSKDLEFNCRERNAIIEGNNHIITLNGECDFLSVTGNGHKVYVDAVTTIKVTGNGNHVTYERGADRRSPRIIKSGLRNKVVRRKRN